MQRQKPKWNEEYTMGKVLDLAEENVKSTAEWTSPEQVIDVVEKLYNYLTDNNSTQANEQVFTDLLLTDIYYATVLQVLQGEQHIVAVRPIEEGSMWFEFTSRNSLFRMDQLEEILLILDQQ